MSYNNYQPNTYPRRSLSRYEEAKKPALGKRLIEAFLTQFTICALVTGVVFGARFLKLPNIKQNIEKVKTIITYSPSLKELTIQAKNGASALMQKINPEDQGAKQIEIPIIIVDDEIF